ncbi:MAG TPA: hypothetical protein EYG34_02070 [Acidimicrobiia bacterium]|nr:hypothetical protein [Acidimicrobiia bacterium]HIL45887.1 hypothetical protein [Acidimicrobiia bacterium]
MNEENNPPEPEPSEETTAAFAEPPADPELDALEADLATIEAAMNRVADGDLDGAEEIMSSLADNETSEPSEQVGDRAVAHQINPITET